MPSSILSQLIYISSNGICYNGHMIKQLSTKLIHKTPFITVREDEVEFANQHGGSFTVVERIPFIVVAAFTGSSFVMVKQYRYAVQHDSLEFVAGAHHDDPHMDPVELAKAELQEETGYIAKTLTPLGTFYPSPAAINSTFYAFLATDLEQSTQKLDTTEADLEVVEISVKKFERMLIEGKITDSPTVTTYAMLKVKKLVQ